MNPAPETADHGIVYTFYSYKGGSGRSMAVANVAALLARWGHSVLLIDWDLEAPGLERFFLNSGVAQNNEQKSGIVDLIGAQEDGRSIDWRECVYEFRLNGSVSPVSLINAGLRDDGYAGRMQRLDFQRLFAERNLGAYIESLRRSWVSEFEFVLVDSRTGLTDIGGICTVHLADVLILLLTSTNSSVEGGLEIVNRAREAREHLPLDRGKLLVVPLPSRDESRTEYERAAEWKRRFAATFDSQYRDWLPNGSSIQEAIDLLRIPYIPYWSFGERLPVLEESAGDPTGLAYAYEVLARLIASKLDWNEALKVRTAGPPPRVEGRTLNEEWAARNRRNALAGLANVSKKGFAEVYHCCVDSPIDRSQDQLLKAARQAMIHTFGWPIGLVLDRDDARPRPTNEGIVAEIKATGFVAGEMYDYWILSKKGDFYTLMSLFEDDRDENVIFFDTQIIRTTEALLHCFNLYRALGTDLRATIQLRVAYGGLRGRRLKSAGRRPLFTPYVNNYEDEAMAETLFRLDQIDTKIVQLVMDLCSPLFVLFDFFKLDEAIYRDLVTNFVQGRIS